MQRMDCTEEGDKPGNRQSYRVRGVWIACTTNGNLENWKNDFNSLDVLVTFLSGQRQSCSLSHELFIHSKWLPEAS